MISDAIAECTNADEQGMGSSLHPRQRKGIVRELRERQEYKNTTRTRCDAPAVLVPCSPLVDCEACPFFDLRDGTISAAVARTGRLSTCAACTTARHLLPCAAHLHIPRAVHCSALLCSTLVYLLLRSSTVSCTYSTILYNTTLLCSREEQNRAE